ncbi:hypothetical protein NEUTE1DRAFT_117305 [Neurospora tetrasperma FGSC 2508]|uniref:Secreted protein n=1 Tax=Neurospora tetrasperma (strain FGSC 2508 / ATCC MYA-4615 / P0657) TaxID=510951 RepID=F8MPU9_NEUT8|nr:uncharacterized protein NEUTE1DRAFT_117305 [Neurospora tetrasperma FGSC 2508]EGO56379.1 hypothetical protein NEUTE1DRAFT_117305 [Neurospora tetrasperma FGSC 2508]
MDGATRCGGRRSVTPSNWLIFIFFVVERLATLPTYSPGVWHKRTKIPLDSKGLMSFQVKRRRTLKTYSKQSIALAMVWKGCRIG